MQFLQEKHLFIILVLLSTLVGYITQLTDGIAVEV